MRVCLYLIGTCSAASSLKFLTPRNFVDSICAGDATEQTGPSLCGQEQNLIGGRKVRGGDEPCLTLGDAEKPRAVRETRAPMQKGKPSPSEAQRVTSYKSELPKPIL